MLSNLFFYFQLAWFCLKLSFELVLFLVIFLIKKANQKKLTEILLIILIILILALNLYVLRQKNTVQINLEETKIAEGLDQEFIINRIILKENDLKTELEAYQKIEDMKIQNLGLFLNLATINQVLEKTDLSKEYFSKAQKIEPKIKYLEN